MRREARVRREALNHLHASTIWTSLAENSTLGAVMNLKIPENLSRIRVSDAVTRTLESGVRQGEAEHSTLRRGTSEIPSGCNTLFSKRLTMLCNLASS